MKPKYIHKIANKSPKQVFHPGATQFILSILFVLIRVIRGLLHNPGLLFSFV